MKVTLAPAQMVVPTFEATDTEGVGKAVQVVPVVTPPVAIQLEVAPVSAKLTNVPVLLLPLASVKLVIAVFVPAAVPWLNL